MMSRDQILLLWAALLAVMLACRCLPLLLLRGRELPDKARRAIGLIPAAAFAALVANDLVKLEDYAADPRLAVVNLVSAALVLAVARKTGSLVWCAVVGMVVYLALGTLLG